MKKEKRNEGSAEGGEGQKGGKSGESAFAQATAKQMPSECNWDVFPIEVMFGRDSRGALNTLRGPSKVVFSPVLLKGKFKGKKKKSLNNLGCPETDWSHSSGGSITRLFAESHLTTSRPRLLNSDGLPQPDHLKFNGDSCYFLTLLTLILFTLIRPPKKCFWGS